jgi:3-isopropylmalate/(R)-2-methylmalate dehydratase small subunit
MTTPRKLPTISGGSGPRLVRHTGVAACIDIRDDEGELIGPDVAFEKVGDASILIVPQLFETESPETTLARLSRLDVRVIISPGFEARLHQRCVSTGVLALPLGDEAVVRLAEWAASRPRPTLTIDLDAQLIELVGSGSPPLSFEVDPRVRRKLLLGLTDEEEMLQHFGSTAALRSEDRKRRPWLYDPR